LKALLFGFPLLALSPVVLSAQGSLRISPPAVRLTLGPLSIRATVNVGGVGVTAGPRSRRPSGAATGRGASRASAAGILATGERYVGARYTYGGETPGAGFDCSGFVQYVFGRHDIELPRTSRQQATAGTRVSGGLAALRPGDLLLFSSTGGRIDHVAIYAGEGRILHSSRGLGGVGYDDLSSTRGQWFVEHHVASRRVVG
jgi:cell wall-associated NlpC family hydrolase